MIGTSLSPGQIRNAPPEVRQWLEPQIAATLGLSCPEPALRAPERQLIGCTPDDAKAILSLVDTMLPVVSVFFELGRETSAGVTHGRRALRLHEMARHARLQAPDQVVACLRLIDEAVQRVSGAPDAMLTALDGAGHCLVADGTARSILAISQEIVAPRDLVPARTMPLQARDEAAAPMDGLVAGGVM